MSNNDACERKVFDALRKLTMELQMVCDKNPKDAKLIWPLCFEILRLLRAANKANPGFINLLSDKLEKRAMESGGVTLVQLASILTKMKLNSTDVSQKIKNKTVRFTRRFTNDIFKSHSVPDLIDAIAKRIQKIEKILVRCESTTPEKIFDGVLMGLLAIATCKTAVMMFPKAAAALSSTATSTLEGLSSYLPTAAVEHVAIPLHDIATSAVQRVARPFYDIATSVSSARDAAISNPSKAASAAYEALSGAASAAKETAKKGKLFETAANMVRHTVKEHENAFLGDARANDNLGNYSHFALNFARKAIGPFNKWGAEPATVVNRLADADLARKALIRGGGTVMGMVGVRGVRQRWKGESKAGKNVQVRRNSEGHWLFPDR